MGLTSGDIYKWRNQISIDISNVIYNLDKIRGDATNLKDITDDSGLKTRYEDLIGLMNSAVKKIREHQSKFNAELKSWIANIENAEAEAEKEAKAQIDQFAENTKKLNDMDN